MLIWFRTSCLAPHLPAHAPASGGVECPRSFALAAMTASGPRAAKRGSMSSGMCASVASCTRSDSRPGVEETSGVSPVADDVSPRMTSFRGAGRDAGSWMIKPMQGSISQPLSGSKINTLRTVSQLGWESRTSVDEGPSTHVYSTPETASFCKVPPVSVFVAKHVSSRLLVIMQSFVVARRTWVCRGEELVNRIAIGRFYACQGERGAKKGAKACGAVQVDPWLRCADEVSSVQGPSSEK